MLASRLRSRTLLQQLLDLCRDVQCQSRSVTNMPKRSCCLRCFACRIWALRLEEVERAWSDRLSAAVASASSKVEDFQQRQSLEAAKAAEAAALNAAEAESRWGHLQLAGVWHVSSKAAKPCWLAVACLQQLAASGCTHIG
jgi:hypothetical protein